MKQAGDFEANQPKVSYINRPLPPLANVGPGSKLDGTLSHKFCSVGVMAYCHTFPDSDTDSDCKPNVKL